VATDDAVVQLQVNDCRLYTHCFNCARDPYCGWSIARYACLPYQPSSRCVLLSDAHNTLFASKRSAIYAQAVKLFTSCIVERTWGISFFKWRYTNVLIIIIIIIIIIIRQGLVSRESIVDGDWLSATEWYQCYLPFCQPASDVAENLGIRGGFLYGVYRPGELLELIPTVKMELRHPAEGSFGSKFSAICSHCGVMAAGSLKTPIFGWSL